MNKEILKQKILDAIVDMESKIERDSEHIYRDISTGSRLQGVTSVSGILPKEWLSSWGAKEAVKALGYTDYEDYTLLTEILKKIKGCTPKQYLELLKDAKGAHRRKSKKAMVDGKKGHQWLEDFVKAKITGNNAPLIESKELARPLLQFTDWATKNISEWIASECYIVRPDKYYAGQLDAIAFDTQDKLVLIDFKFATNISEDYFLQTAGYAAAFEPYDIKFDDRIIVRLPKTLEREEWDDREHRYRMAPNNIEVKVVPTIYEGDRDTFFAALQVKGWINQFIKE